VHCASATDTLDGGARTTTLPNGETTITNTLTASIQNRVLVVNGSADDDVLSIQTPDPLSGAATLTLFGKTYNPKDFDAVKLNMLDGNDFAEIAGVKISVIGGNGDDTLFLRGGVTLSSFDG